MSLEVEHAERLRLRRAYYQANRERILELQRVRQRQQYHRWPDIREYRKARALAYHAANREKRLAQMRARYGARRIRMRHSLSAQP